MLILIFFILSRMLQVRRQGQRRRPFQRFQPRRPQRRQRPSPFLKVPNAGQGPLAAPSALVPGTSSSFFYLNQYQISARLLLSSIIAFISKLVSIIISKLIQNQC